MSKIHAMLVALIALLVGVGLGLFIGLQTRNAGLIDSLREENKLLRKLNETLEERAVTAEKKG